MHGLRVRPAGVRIHETNMEIILVCIVSQEKAGVTGTSLTQFVVVCGVVSNNSLLVPLGPHGPGHVSENAVPGLFGSALALRVEPVDVVVEVFEKVYLSLVTVLFRAMACVLEIGFELVSYVLPGALIVIDDDLVGRLDLDTHRSDSDEVSCAGHHLIAHSLVVSFLRVAVVDDRQ